MYGTGSRALAMLLIATTLGTACRGIESPPPGDETLAHLAGRIIIDGSSTVYPIAQAIAEEFGYLAGNVQIPVGISGTGGGFTKFCAGESDMTNASRPIRQIEADACAANGIEFIELPVGFDGLSVMVNPNNDWATCLTVQQLRRMWEPDAERAIDNWNDIDPNFPDEKLMLYGPGTDSGTFEYFTQVITGEVGFSRGDFTGSEDDNILVQGVAGNTGALGFFGYAYYVENQERLKLIGVDDGPGCVLPSEETIADGTYQPLSRPIFMYINADEAERLEAVEFVEFLLLDGAEIIGEVGYIPFPEEIYLILYDRFMSGRTGTVFIEGTSTSGVRLADLLFAEERE
jgi:phosphate transport system substrate-binding protein